MSRLVLLMTVKQPGPEAVHRFSVVGVPAVYVNYLDYDVFAHAFGPAHRSAMRALYHIDSSIGQLARVVGRLPEYHYDLYILSDHGQTPTRNFRQVSGGDESDRLGLACEGNRLPRRRVWSAKMSVQRCPSHARMSAKASSHTHRANASPIGNSRDSGDRHRRVVRSSR